MLFAPEQQAQRYTQYSSAPGYPQQRSLPSRQDFQWLGELQHHAADYEYLKPQLKERRSELQRQQARLNFWTREIQDCRKQIRDSAWAHSSQRRELQDQLRGLHLNRDVARQEYEAQKVEYERVDRQVQKHKENIHTLMRGLRIIVSS